MLNGITIHSNLEALFESARSTLITMCFIDLAQPVALWLANILSVASDGALKESSAAVARVDPVVFARAVISTDLAWNIVQNSAWRKKKKHKKLVKIRKPSSGAKKMKCESIVHHSHPVGTFFHEWTLRAWNAQGSRCGEKNYHVSHWN